jgi:rhodanese-related sulfurtransferase
MAIERSEERQPGDESRVDRLLARARARIEPRVCPSQLIGVAPEMLVVDIRPDEQRRRDGELPGAIAIDRNVLEWRLDPSSPDRAAFVRKSQRVVLVCNEGYQSSLAAAVLRELGVDATDMIGGFRAWQQSSQSLRKT